MRVNFFCILLLLPLLLNAQRYYTQRISMDDGLPSNTIRDIYKDSRGLMWFATEAGLVRYNGREFTTYTSKDGLPGNKIWSITEDTLGNLWLACYGNGISKFDGRTFTNYSTPDGLVNENVRVVKYSHKHKGLMIGTIFGFSFFRDSSFTSFAEPFFYNRNLMQVTSFIETDTSIYLLTYWDCKQFLSFNPQKNTFSYLPNNHRFHKGFPYSTGAYITQNNDTIIGLYIHGVKFYAKDTLIVNENVGQIFDFAEDNEGNIWLASWNNYDLHNKDDKGGVYIVKNYKEEHYNQKLGIETEQCWSLYFDSNEELMWVGTVDKGIYLCSTNGILHYPAKEVNPDDPVIRDVFVDNKQNIWVSAGTGLYKNFVNYDKSLVNRLNISYLSRIDEAIEQKRAELAEKPGNREQLLSSIKSLVESKKERVSQFYRLNQDSQGRMYLGTNVGIFQFGNSYDLQEKIFMKTSIVVNTEYFFPSSSVISVMSFYNIESYDLIKKEYHYGPALFRKNITYSSFGKHLSLNGNIWIISDTDGICKFENGEIMQFPYLQGQIEPNLNAICAGANDDFFIGTTTGSIYQLILRNDSLIVEKTIGINTNLTGSKVKWLAMSNNLLYAGTNKGLFEFNPYNPDANFRFFNAQNGFFDYNGYKATTDSSGNIYVASEDNITKIKAGFGSKFNLSESGNIELNEVFINNKRVDWCSFASAEKWCNVPQKVIKLGHNQNSITIQFNLLQYSNNASNRYSYRLEGTSMDWTEFSAEPRAVFTYLNHGKYKFMLKGYNLSNPSQVSYLEFSFHIAPPWYKTWWFYLLLILGFIAMIFLAYKNRIKKFEEKAAINYRISELRLDALKAQMNPHFVFNAFNPLQKLILENETRQALKYLSQFSGLIRKTLDNSTKKAISLAQEIEYLNEYLNIEQIRMKNFSFSIYIDDCIDQSSVQIPPMLIQPIVENALYHGIRHLNGIGVLKISFNCDMQFVNVTIEDNGVGREKSKEINSKQRIGHKSYGTNITEERLKLLFEEFKDNISYNIEDLYCKNQPAGTKVSIKIPIKFDY